MPIYFLRRVIASLLIYFSSLFFSAITTLSLMLFAAFDVFFDAADYAFAAISRRFFALVSMPL